MEIHNNKGFTIIEALVALVILTILLLGLLSSLIFVYEYSTKNLIRDEAVKLAQEYAEKYRNISLENIPSSKTETIKRKIRNTEIYYTIKTTSTDISTGLMRSIKITITWNYKGKRYSHTIGTLVGRKK